MKLYQHSLLKKKWSCATCWFAMCVVIACVKRRGFCHTHAKAEKSKQSDVTEKVKVNNRLIFSLQFSSVSFMRCNNKNISQKYLSNALTHLTENEKIHFWTFTSYSKKKVCKTEHTFNKSLFLQCFQGGSSGDELL